MGHDVTGAIYSENRLSAPTEADEARMCAVCRERNSHNGLKYPFAKQNSIIYNRTGEGAVEESWKLCVHWKFHFNFCMFRPLFGVCCWYLFKANAEMFCSVRRCMEPESRYISYFHPFSFSLVLMQSGESISQYLNFSFVPCSNSCLTLFSNSFVLCIVCVLILFCVVIWSLEMFRYNKDKSALVLDKHNFTETSSIF